MLGPDESSGYKQAAYQINSGGQIVEENSKKKEKKPTKSLYSSQFSIVQIRAVLPDGTVKVLFVNKFANSIFGHQPLRHSPEKETAEAAIKEGIRLRNQADSLVHFQVPKDDVNDPDLEIEYDPYESLMDGKTKYV